jgi:hypothetical protein
MQGPEIQTRKQAERSNITTDTRRKGGAITPFLFILFIACALLAAGTSSWAQRAEKKSKKVIAAQKEVAINDATVQDYLKKAEDQLRKGDIDAALPTLLRVHEYSDDVLKTVKLFKTQYEKAVNDSSLSQGDRENIIIKMNRMGQLIPKYTALKEASAYDLGYVYAKKGDGDRARRYLLKVFETAPFSTKQDSVWMKSKKLLLALYSLEGEF